jgi:hypothetical protein
MEVPDGSSEEEAGRAGEVESEVQDHDGARRPRSPETLRARRQHKKDQERRQKERRHLATEKMVEQACLSNITFARRIALPPAQTVIDWRELPASLHPNFENDRLATRGERKQQQCESFLRVCEPIIR